MPRKKYTPEQIIQKLREAEIRLGQGEALDQVCRALAISEQTFYRWRKEFGGLRLSQAHRLKGLERENELLRRLVRSSPYFSR
jgi:putative transposase